MFDANGTVLAPAALAPNGQIEAVGGGYRLNGRWSWATGVMESDWVIVTGLSEVDGRFDVRFCALPIADVAVDDVWHMAGMRATGSNDVVITDTFIPEHRTLPVEARMPEQRASVRLAAAQAVLLSRQAINTVCEASEASAYADSSPLQRIRRDVETLKGHVVFDWDRTTELLGRVKLGLKLRPGDLL